MKLTHALISKRALRHNISVIRQRLSQATSISAVVKANAYGHGLIGMAKTLASIGIKHFSVATEDEADQLIQSEVSGEILILGSLLNSINYREAVPFRTRQVTMSLGSKEELEAVREFLGSRTERIAAHIKIDTGMGRRGFRWDQIGDLVDELRKIQQLEITGLMTHFSQAQTIQDRFTLLQIKRFDDAQSAFRSAGFYPKLIHASNTGGTFHYPQAHYNLVRTGLAMYGLYSAIPRLIPVMTVKSAVAQLKEVNRGDSVGYSRGFIANKKTRVGIIPIGYADGIKRTYALTRPALLVGKKVVRTRFLGRICMDMMMVDCSKLPRTKNGSLAEVVIFSDGRGSMQRAPTVLEIASKTGQIPYEVVTGIGDRVERLYVE